MGVSGYGSFQVNRRARGAHRIAWQLANGRELVKPEFVCHHCDNRPCCNPTHLFVGTVTDNVRDMLAKGRGGGPLNENRDKVACPQGHPYDKVEHRGDGSPFRACSICAREHKRAYKQRQRALRDGRRL